MRKKTTSKERKFFIFLVCIFYFLFFIFDFSKAAVLSPAAEQTEYNVGDIFIVSLKLDSQGEYVNVIQGNLKFSQDALQVEDFSQGNSIITLWVERPGFSNSDGAISFAGGIPNGFEGKDGLLGKVIFKAMTTGDAQIEFFGNSSVLLNDGVGSKADLSVNKLNLKIKTAEPPLEAPVIDEWQEKLAKDNVSPESFKIFINQEATLFNGQYYIIFSTVDKQTGVDYYEVKEGELAWQKAASPYLLKDQSLEQAIQVKAVDNTGNERIEIKHPRFYPELVPEERRVGPMEIILIFAGLVVLCYSIVRLVKRSRRE